MNFKKYYQDSAYIRDVNDCWNFVQKVFKDEHNIDLPDHPVMVDNATILSSLKSNIKYKIVATAHKGCIVYFHNENIDHVGYALNSRQFIHKTKTSVEIAPIPPKAIIYEIL